MLHYSINTIATNFLKRCCSPAPGANARRDRSPAADELVRLGGQFRDHTLDVAVPQERLQSLGPWRRLYRSSAMHRLAAMRSSRADAENQHDIATGVAKRVNIWLILRQNL